MRRSESGSHLDRRFIAELRRLYAVHVDLPCPSCRYNLRGVEGHRCPECGEDIREYKRLADTNLRRLRAIRRARKRHAAKLIAAWLAGVMGVACAGWVLYVVL